RENKDHQEAITTMSLGLFALGPAGSGSMWGANVGMSQISFRSFNYKPMYYDGSVKSFPRPSTMSLNNPNSFRGVNPKIVESYLTSNGWKGVSTNPNKLYNAGIRLTNGVRGEQIRIMPGGKTRSVQVKQGPHMIISMNGNKTVIPLKGNPTLK
ncbi:hypothetical protein, partial [Kordia sp.]|uniref:hypothetical protein n=1 Tax=Kordia sp. TaxID=1965332 RepID=UPI0025C5E9AE